MIILGILLRKVSVFFIIIVLNSCACRHDMTACFTVDKTHANVGDTITFVDCSNYDGESERASWFFGDGEKIYDSNKKVMTHIYKKAGNYKAGISIGGAECGDDKEMEIVIAE